MSSRILVAGTAPTPVVAQVVTELTALLPQIKDESFEVTNTLAGTSLTRAITNPAAALSEAVISLRSDTGTGLLIQGLGSSPAPSFDVLGWNFDVAANTAAGVILVIDGSGMSHQLLVDETTSALRRAEEHHAGVCGIVIGSVTGELPSVEGVPVVGLPLTAASANAITGPTHTVITPIMFQADLIERARANRQRIVLPEPEDDRILQACAQLLEKQVAEIILVGEPQEVTDRATKLGLNISAATIVPSTSAELVEKYATEFQKLRAKKGVTIEAAREKVQDATYFATMMVHMGDADGMVSGAIHTTADTIVPAFQIIKTAPGVSLVSSAFLMLLPDKVLVMGDCAVNPNPTPDQLAEIAVSTARTASQFGLDPLVAMLSYSTGTSGAGPDVEAVEKATARVMELDSDLKVEGPIQYDAAVDAGVGAAKAPQSEVAGAANVLIFPNLNAGNIAYKAVQRSAGAVAVGPILQGLRRPVNDLSRGALVEDIVNTVAITAIQAQNEGKN